MIAVTQGNMVAVRALLLAGAGAPSTFARVAVVHHSRWSCCEGWGVGWLVDASGLRWGEGWLAEAAGFRCRGPTDLAGGGVWVCKGRLGNPAREVRAPGLRRITGTKRRSCN